MTSEKFVFFSCPNSAHGEAATPPKGMRIIKPIKGFFFFLFPPQRQSPGCVLRGFILFVFLLLFLTALGLHYCACTCSNCRKLSLISLVAGSGLLLADTSLVVENRL